MNRIRRSVAIARTLGSELAEYSSPRHGTGVSGKGESAVLDPEANLLAQFDARVVDPHLRSATRSRFVSGHYADAVEAGVKALNECVRIKANRQEDGDELMTAVFSPNKPLLRVNQLRSKNEISEQRGHMQLCQGVIAAWRNPRAHTLVEDSPTRTLMMLELINDLIDSTKRATRTRLKK